MKKDLLEKANELKNEIADIEKFLDIINPKNRKGINSNFDWVSFIIKKDTTLSILGLKSSTSNYSSQSVVVPQSLLDDLYKLSNKRLIILKKEYESLWSNNKQLK
jgi:hypothetical protein